MRMMSSRCMMETARRSVICMRNTDVAKTIGGKRVLGTSEVNKKMIQVRKDVTHLTIVDFEF